MTAHHLKCEAETATQCAYCGHKLDIDELANWKSEHHIRKHYKVNTCCKCKRPMKIEVHFCGSGHDDWIKKIISEVKLKPAKAKAKLEDKV